MSLHRFRPLLLLSLFVALVLGCVGMPEEGPPSDGPAFAPGAAPQLAQPAPVLPVTPELEARVAGLMDDMTLEELLGQRFMAFIPRETTVTPPGGGDGAAEHGARDDGVAGAAATGSRPPGSAPSPGDAGSGVSHLAPLFEPASPAGFILYRWNLPSYKGTVLLTKAVQRAGAQAQGLRVPLLFAVDQEGGRVANLRFPEMPEFPSAFQQGSRRDPEYIESGAYITARDLRRVGIHMNFAPVLDLYPREDRTIIGDRALGNNPQIVGALGEAYIRGSLRGGVVPVAKHFPGHGVTIVDSHGALPRSERTLDSLRRRELIPFRHAIDAGVPAIMTAHILFESIDPDYPATLSPPFIEDVLRDDLGFEGVVVTDGFSMGALTGRYTRVEALRQSFLAGVDLILLHARYDYREVFEETQSLLEAGEISEEMIRTGARRVLLLKGRLGLLP